MPGLFGKSEIRIAGKSGQHAYEIDIQVEELVEGFARLDGGVHRNGRESSVNGRVAVYGGSAGDDARPHGEAGVDFIAPRFETLKIAAHVADAGDSKRKKHGKLILLAPEVDVHVPQAGDKELAAPVDDTRVVKKSSGNGCACGDYGRDLVAIQDDRNVGARGAGRNVDDRYILNRDSGQATKAQDRKNCEKLHLEYCSGESKTA